MCLLAPLASFLINKYGTRFLLVYLLFWVFVVARSVCMLGALISFFGMMLSTLCTSVPTLVFTYGFVGGFGQGLMYVPACVSAGYWFENKRSLATGIATSGAGFGIFTLAPLINYLEETNGWKACHIALAGTCLLCALFGATMKPLKYESPPSTAKDNNKIFQENQKVVSIKASLINLLKNKAFLLLMLASPPAAMGHSLFIAFVPGISDENCIPSAEWLISIFGLAMTFPRVIFGAISDHPNINPLVVSCISTFICGLVPFIFVFSFNFPTSAYLSFVFGCSQSAFWCLTNSIIVDMMGLEQLSTGFGVLTFTRGVSFILGPPLGGFIIDTTGEFKSTFYLAGTLLVISSIIHLLCWSVANKEKKKEKQENNLIVTKL